MAHERMGFLSHSALGFKRQNAENFRGHDKFKFEGLIMTMIMMMIIIKISTARFLVNENAIIPMQ